MDPNYFIFIKTNNITNSKMNYPVYFLKIYITYKNIIYKNDYSENLIVKNLIIFIEN